MYSEKSYKSQTKRQTFQDENKYEQATPRSKNGQ